MATTAWKVRYKKKLALVAKYADVRRQLESVVLRWQLETSDFLPFQRDPRFPDVDLESPTRQWDRRGES